MFSISIVLFICTVKNEKVRIIDVKETVKYDKGIYAKELERKVFLYGFPLRRT